MQKHPEEISNKLIVKNCFILKLVPSAGLEPARGVTSDDFKSTASTNSANSAQYSTVKKNEMNIRKLNVKSAEAGPRSQNTKVVIVQRIRNSRVKTPSLIVVPLKRFELLRRKSAAFETAVSTNSTIRAHRA